MGKTRPTSHPEPLRSAIANTQIFYDVIHCAVTSRISSPIIKEGVFVVRYLTTNGKSGTYCCFEAFVLRYRRVNATFYEFIKEGVRKRGSAFQGVETPTS
jgi:hypothetical protein